MHFVFLRTAIVTIFNETRGNKLSNTTTTQQTLMQSYKQILENKFNQEYQRLNDQQRKAVDTIEGPVMVIAGPGTGKTQILASRIGKILLQTDAAPQNILCLTYTDAGVVA